MALSDGRRAGGLRSALFRENLGGTWEVNLTGPKDAFYKLPVITGFPGMKVVVSPYSLTGVRRPANRRVFANDSRKQRGGPVVGHRPPVIPSHRVRGT